MSSITEIWAKSKETFDKKTLSQILSFAGDGKLKDANTTSVEFRELLDQVPSMLLNRFADNCLVDKFEDSGFALQDVVNQIGKRLGFEVGFGLYRGKQNEIGFDGLWASKDGHRIIVEVKTTDAYRINLDIIAEYRNKLTNIYNINKEQSSILIVVGRQDTGDLEAQIRGSKHAWDIRLISVDALLNLLSLKETLNDTRTIQKINELLKPREYTRIDKLIELIFETSKDIQLEEADEINEEEISYEKKKRKSTENKSTPVSFHEECLFKVQERLQMNFIKQSRISYTNKDGSVGLLCAISKTHMSGQNEKFWFAFHPHQKEFLAGFSNSFISLGCGTPDNTFLIPFHDFEPIVKYFWTTEKDGRMYWHIVINKRDGKFLMQQPYNENSDSLDLSNYRI